ncbi:MAG: hypothetical protein VX126_03870, partial [Planctomycetota bacterium]|nr:hypothetical protein [Planctomycetota bacterium]
ATHAGLIAGTSVLTIASTGTAGDLDSVIDGIINDSATISGDDAFSMSGLFAYGFAHTDADDYAGSVGSSHLTFAGEAGGWNWTFNYVLGGNTGYYGSTTTSTTFSPTGTDIFGDPVDIDDIVVTEVDSFRDYGIYKEMDNGFSFGFGNTKSIFLKSNSVAEASTLQINNTLTGAALEGRGEQIGFGYNADQFRVMGRVYDVDGADADGFSFEFRGEFLAMGSSWDNCDCFGAAAGNESTLVFGAAHSDDSLFDGTTFDVTYKVDAFSVHAALTDVLDGNWEATTVQASYAFADATSFYVSYEDIETPAGDFDDLDIGINHHYSDSCKATLEIDFENDAALLGGNDDMTIPGQVQFTF